MTDYLALLRGINVGGKNLIKMADLRAALEAMAFADVKTYIASGNVFFRAPRQPRDELAATLEARLTERFATDLRIVLLTRPLLAKVVAGSPKDFGADGTHLRDVVFVRKPLTAKRAFAAVETREGVDRAWAGPGVVYFSRLASKATSSRLNKVASIPEYKNMTIRSWSTTTKLLGLFEAR